MGWHEEARRLGDTRRIPVDELEWGPIPLGAAVAAAGPLVAALVQRDALFPPTWEVLLALGALSPWLAEHLTPWRPPRLVFAAVTIGFVVALLVNAVENDFAPFTLVVLAAEMGATAPLGVAAPATLAAIAAMVGLDMADQFTGTAIWACGIAAGMASGGFVQMQLRVLAQVRVAQQHLAEESVEEERRRIAREVHDVVAHSLSVTMLHLTGARHSLETGGDVEDAVEALREAEAAGRQSMADIRRTVGLLGSEAGGAARPEPGAAEIAELVEGMSAAGVEVDYRVEGDPSGVPLSTGLGLYRIAQESLTNAARHAPGSPVRMRLEVGGEAVSLSVRNRRNGGAPSSAAEEDGGGGLGIPGMAQRADLLGGRLRAEPEGDEWVVEVTVPREAATA